MIEDRLGFSLTVPDSWFELDVRPAIRDAAIQALVRERLVAQPELWTHRSEVVRLLRRTARQAWQSGARYCAALVLPTADGPLTAAVTVTLLAAPADAPQPELDRVEDLLHRLTPRPARQDDEPWTQVGVVELPEVGTAARSHGVEDVELPDGAGWIRSVLMQTFVPVPGTAHVLLVSCSSPVLPLAETWFDLFDAITGTFRLVERPEPATVKGRPG